MRVAVIGGTGRLGSLVVARLVERGVDVRVMVRSIERAARVPEQARAVAGDLERPDSVRRVTIGADRLMLITPFVPDESEAARAALEAATATGVRRLVYVSCYGASRAPHVPHFASKVAIEDMIERSALAWTILQPAPFFQNDLSVRGRIEAGLYPVPLGDAGVQRVDARDVADAAVTALTTSGHEGRRYPLVGADAHTGRSVAEAWSHALGRDVRYAGGDVEEWAGTLGRAVPPWKRAELKEMYLHFQRRGLRAEGADLDALSRILDDPPRTFAAFVREETRRPSPIAKMCAP